MWTGHVGTTGSRAAAPGGAWPPVASSVEVGILGPLVLRVDGAVVEVGAAKLRSLALDLVVHVNEVVSTDRLIDDLWGDHPPMTALGTLRTYVARLRTLLAEAGAAVVATVPPGDCLQLDPGSIDAERFVSQRDDAAQLDGDRSRRSGPPSGCRSISWRGPALVDVAYDEWAQPTIARLEEQPALGGAWRACRVAARRSARHAVLVAELEAHVAAQPLRERLRGQLMVALYRAGCQADVLRI